MARIAPTKLRVRRMLAIGCIAWAATYACQTPGLLHAMLAVGDDSRLPLERLAADTAETAETGNAGPAPVTSPAAALPASSTRDERHTATPVREDAQALFDGEPAAAARKHRLARGYERTITDSKYWT